MSHELRMMIQNDLMGIKSGVQSLDDQKIQSSTFLADGMGSGMSFSDRLKEAIHQVDDKAQMADQKMEAVDGGSSDDLIGAMLASQDASLSFSMLMQVRNKVVGALDELIKLQL
jgi:flagellar hook-basal body complex protein FliE